MLSFVFLSRSLLTKFDLPFTPKLLFHASLAPLSTTVFELRVFNLTVLMLDYHLVIHQVLLFPALLAPPPLQLAS